MNPDMIHVHGFTVHQAVNVALSDQYVPFLSLPDNQRSWTSEDDAKVVPSLGCSRSKARVSPQSREEGLSRTDELRNAIDKMHSSVLIPHRCCRAFAPEKIGMSQYPVGHVLFVLTEVLEHLAFRSPGHELRQPSNKGAQTLDRSTSSRKVWYTFQRISASFCLVRAGASKRRLRKQFARSNLLGRLRLSGIQGLRLPRTARRVL